MRPNDGIKRYAMQEAFADRFGLRPSEFMSRLTTAEWRKVEALPVGQSITLRAGIDSITFTRTD